ncbi:MAG TPA: hypothetical protein VNY73_06440 [Bacteroidia bacterium]|nr:hypothetical protein [Bacteroidia bacterium]
MTSLALTAFRSDKDPLHKRKFAAKAQAIDAKDNTPKGKPFEDEIEFKNGKVYSLACWDKMEFQDIKYEITKDSTYKEGEEEKRLFEILATSSNDKKEQLCMNITIDGYDIKCIYKLIKKDVIKKMFTSNGTEKVKKK